MIEMKRQSNLLPLISFISPAFLRKLESALSQSFNIDTCYPGERKDWTKDIPSYGQCAVAALVVQDYLGGEIVYDQRNIHFWNRIGGVDIDLSREQFEEGVILRETRIRPRQELLEGPRAEAAETLQRYRILCARVREHLNDALAIQPLAHCSEFMILQTNSDQSPGNR
jgi:hypothetical protein